MALPGLGDLFGGGNDTPWGGDPFGSNASQRLLPKQLRKRTTGPILNDWISQLGDLIKNPGGLSPTVSEAVIPRLSMESQSIGQNYRNMQAENAGAAARSNLPVSIKNALARALDIAQERAQRDARFAALTESDQLRRQDIGQGFNLMDAIKSFLGMQKGIDTQVYGQRLQDSASRQAATMQLIGSLFSGGAGLMK